MYFRFVKIKEVITLKELLQQMVYGSNDHLLSPQLTVPEEDRVVFTAPTVRFSHRRHLIADSFRSHRWHNPLNLCN